MSGFEQNKAGITAQAETSLGTPDGRAKHARRKLVRTRRIRHLAITVVALQAFLAKSPAVNFEFDSLSSPPRAGELGDLSRVAFAGNKTFADETLRHALASDLEIAVMVRPDAGLDDTLGLLERRLGAGYQHEGFPEAKVHAEADTTSERIVLYITEGPRFYNRNVRVTGLKSIKSELVKERILELVSTNNPATRTSSPLEPVGGTNSSADATANDATDSPPTPLWEANSPAPMDTVTEGLLAEEVTNAFDDLGLFKARFALKLDRQAAAFPNSPPGVDGHWADMLVEVQDEGPACTIGGIEVAGLRKNPEPGLLRWLGLAPGMKLTRRLLIEKHRQLIESGRFTMAELEPGTPDADGKVKLRINVRELEDAPLLSAKLSRREKTMMRLGHWARDWPNQKEDAVWRFVARNANGTTRDFADCIVSPTAGMLVRFSAAGDPATSPDCVFYANSNHFAMIDGTRREGLLATNSKYSMTIFAKLNLDPDGKGSFTFGAGAGVKSSADPINIKLDAMAPALIWFARRPGVTWHEEHGVLISSSSNVDSRVEAKTGRLLALNYRFSGTSEPEIERAFGFSGTPEGFIVEFKPNALERAMAEAKTATAGFTNRWEDEHRLSSIFGFVAMEVLRSPVLLRLAQTNATAGAITAATPALAKLFDRDLFSAWEFMLRPADAASGGETFEIPWDINGDFGGKTPLQALGAVVLGFTGKLVAPDSWIGTVAREAVLGFTGPASESGKGWERLYSSPDTGPLACLVAAHMLNSNAAKAFATSGLTRLTPDRFRHDCRPLLEGNEALPVTTRKFLTRLASLNDAEIESIAALLPLAEASAMRETVRVLRQPNTTPSLDVVGPVLDHWWEATLHSQLSARLHLARDKQP